MKDGALKQCVAVVAVAAIYITYQVVHPESDGIILASVIGAIGGLIGYGVAVKRTKRA